MIDSFEEDSTHTSSATRATAEKSTTPRVDVLTPEGGTSMFEKLRETGRKLQAWNQEGKQSPLFIPRGLGENTFDIKLGQQVGVHRDAQRSGTALSKKEVRRQEDRECQAGSRSPTMVVD